MKIKPEWEILPEAEKIIKHLCEMYPDKLGHISADAIGCAAISNKDKPDSQKWDAKIKGVVEPEALYSSKRYVIYFYMNTWEDYNGAQRAAMLMAKLLRIPDEPDGSVVVEDLKDVKCLVRAFGVDYIANPDLPDLAGSKIEF